MPPPKKLTMMEKHPELFTPQTNIDRREHERVVPMEVMNLGFPRTGTMSIQAALNILGYNCYHSSVFFSNIRDCATWNDAMDAKYLHRGTPFTRPDWDRLLGSYSAVSADPPAVAFAEDLVAAYPDAKVILVEREIEAWYRSFDANVIAAQWSAWISFASALDPWFLGPVRRCHRRWATAWMDAHGAAEMRAKARHAYRAHYALVRRVTPPERLLEYRLGDGWGPLCAFLGKPVPQVPFPRVNDSEALQELLAVVIRRGLWGVWRRVLRVVLVLGVVGLGVWLCYRARRLRWCHGMQIFDLVVARGGSRPEDCSELRVVPNAAAEEVSVSTAA